MRLNGWIGRLAVVACVGLFVGVGLCLDRVALATPEVAVTPLSEHVQKEVVGGATCYNLDTHNPNDCSQTCYWDGNFWYSRQPYPVAWLEYEDDSWPHNNYFSTTINGTVTGCREYWYIDSCGGTLDHYTSETYLKYGLSGYGC